MSFLQGEVVLGLFPLAAGGLPKKRPILVVQSDSYNSRLANRIVALITSNLAHATARPPSSSISKRRTGKRPAC